MTLNGRLIFIALVRIIFLTLGLLFLTGGVKLYIFLEQFFDFIVINRIYSLYDIAYVPFIGFIKLFMLTFDMPIERTIA